MAVDYQKVWSAMNDLEMITSKIVSAREIIDTAAEAIQNHDYNRAETLAMAAYEFLGYYLDEFDEKFKPAWQATVGDLRDSDAVKPLIFSCDGEDKTPRWNDFWEENYYPDEYKDSTVSSQYTDQELDAMCDKAASDEEKEKCREYNLREAEYYNKRQELDATHSKYYYDYTRNDPNRLNPFSGKVYESPDGGKTVYARNPGETKRTLVTQDKVVKWVLPVQQKIEDGIDDYYVQFPDDLLESSNLKEGDTIEWIDRGDGSYLLRKITKSLEM